MRPSPARHLISLAGRLVVGRLVVGLCLLLALQPPASPWGRAELDLAVLVDESLSMPQEFSTQAWHQVLALLALAPSDTAVRLLRFAAAPARDAALRSAAELVAEPSLPRTQALDTSATNIARPLREVLFRAAADRPSAILLLSDGVASHGDTAAALRAAYDASVPVYLLEPAADVSALPLRLLAVQVPPQVALGEQVPVQARVQSARGGPVDVLLETDAGVIERRQLTLAAGLPESVTFTYATQVAGVQQLRVRLDPLEGASADDRIANPPQVGAPWLAQTRVVNVLGLQPVFLVSAQSNPNPLARALQMAGWAVDGATPGAFMAHQTGWTKAGIIVLDDVAITDMPASAWAALVDAVRNDGKGLVVLGGGNSFGAGAYRHSPLEKILPVTAEAASPQQPAAVMFVLDRSGSMGRAHSGPSRLALARRAIAASVELLLPGDQLGIVAFAADVETRLAMTSRGSATDAVDAALDVGASGGTRLVPALRAALQQLRSVDVGQRLIILVTDGFAGDVNVSALSEQLRAAGITVIALAVGSATDHATLRTLTSFNGGRLLEVSNIAELPRLMPSELARERSPAQAAATATQQVQPIRFLSGSGLQWPALSAYMVSKARSHAQVYLQSAQGDPLFATGLAGAGRVAVLTGGFGSWAQAWWAWPEFGRFLGGLLLAVGQNDSHAQLSLRVENQPGQLVYRFDQQWVGEPLAPEPGLLSVRGPTGTVTGVVPRMESAGHYHAIVPVTATGLYEATLHLEDRSVRLASYRNASNEFQSGVDTRQQIQAWTERGWLRPWPDAAGFARDWPPAPAGTRRVLLLLALFAYVTVLLWERGLLLLALQQVRLRFSR